MEKSIPLQKKTQAIYHFCLTGRRKMEVKPMKAFFYNKEQEPLKAEEKRKGRNSSNHSPRINSNAKLYTYCTAKIQ